MRCVKCGRKLKLRSDGWRRCGKGCSKVMGVELRCATFKMHLIESAADSVPPVERTEFKLKLKPTWRSEDRRGSEG